MKNYLIFALLFASSGLLSQVLPNPTFTEIETIPCPFDPTVTVKAYVGWQIYQTLDGSWQGPIDSNRCISIASNTSKGISLQGANLDLPIFLKVKFTDDNKIPLEKNQLYNASIYELYNTNEVELVNGIGCQDNLCSGILVGVEIPDSTGTGTFIRWYTDIPNTYQTNNIYFETCIATENFDESFLREFVVKMTPAPGTTSDKHIQMVFASFWSFGDLSYISEIIAPASSFVDTSYQVFAEMVGTPIFGGVTGDYMLTYNDLTTWPNPSHISYVEGRPDVNTPEPKIINLIIGEDETLIPQPYASIRGALVEGSDSIRHHVNLVNNGGDICFGYIIIDLVFGGGTKYVHQGGHINFEGQSSCMMFMDGGALEVADNTTLYFGEEGKGIMALRPGSNIYLGKGSTLLIDNLLWLQGIPTPAYPEPQFYMSLNPGSTLAFGEHANIFNGLSVTPDTRLNIFMNGGTLDESNLSPAARNLINKIYPTPKTRLSDNLKLMENPVEQFIQLSYFAKKEGLVELELFDLQGRNLGKETRQAYLGPNTFQVEVAPDFAGMGVLKVSTTEGSAALKVVRL